MRSVLPVRRTANLQQGAAALPGLSSVADLPEKFIERQSVRHQASPAKIKASASQTVSLRRHPGK